VGDEVGQLRQPSAISKKRNFLIYLWFQSRNQFYFLFLNWNRSYLFVPVLEPVFVRFYLFDVTKKLQSRTIG